MVNPKATYDLLYLAKRLQEIMEDFSRSEIHFLSYFSCLLSIYDGHPQQDWDYDFVKTENGSPTSAEIEASLDSMLAGEYVKNLPEDQQFFKLTTKGVQLLEKLDNMSIFIQRKKYLETSCNSLVLMPIGIFKEAIIHDPVIHSARTYLTRKSLLVDNDPATKVLYSQFAKLRLALQDKYDDLIVPAMVWIESLDVTKKLPL